MVSCSLLRQRCSPVNRRFFVNRILLGNVIELHRETCLRLLLKGLGNCLYYSKIYLWCCQYIDDVWNFILLSNSCRLLSGNIYFQVAACLSDCGLFLQVGNVCWTVETEGVREPPQAATAVGLAGPASWAPCRTPCFAQPARNPRGPPTPRRAQSPQRHAGFAAQQHPITLPQPPGSSSRYFL